MSQSEHVDSCLSLVPIFSTLSDQEKEEIIHIIRPKRYEKGDLIYLPGDQGGTLFVLHEGRVKVARLGASGKEQVIRVIGPGDFLGELSLFSSLPHTDMAEAQTKVSMCLIDGEQLKGLMATYPTIALKILEALSRRLEQAENLIESINLYTAEERLAATLLSLSSGEAHFSLSMSKRDLASQLGMTQETLSRTLASLSEDGLIEMEGQRRIKIIDRDGLVSRSGA